MFLLKRTTVPWLVGNDSSCSGPRFSDSFHQFASGLLLPLRRQKQNTCFVTRRSSARRPRVVRRSSLPPPFITSNRYGFGFFFFCGLGEKQAGSHSGTSGTQLFGYELLTLVFPQRTDKVLIVALSASGASVGGPLGASRTAKKKNPPGATHMTASQHVPCRSCWPDKGCLDWGEKTCQAPLDVFGMWDTEAAFMAEG